MKRYIALVVMVGALMGVAHVIELTARPDTGKRPDATKSAPNVQPGHEGHGH